MTEYMLEIELKKENLILFFLISLILCLVIHRFNNIKKEITYQDLLEFPEEYKFGKERVEGISESNILYLRLKLFLEKYKDYNFIVSLSGGVDSMVVLALLSRFIKSNKIMTASIDYNQRLESTSEISFVKRYLRTYNIKNYSKKIIGVSRKKQNSKRKVFEETSQKIRYQLYKQIILDNKWKQDKTIILLGHHKDDLRENIFNNFILGRKLTDLEVMREIVVKEDLIFGRPFLDYPKSDIYKIAHNYDIPYFKDTTPDWSKRGLMRRQLFPLLKKIYPNFENVLDKQGRNSFDLNELIRENCIENFNYIVEDDNKYSIVSWDNDNNSSRLVWGERLSNILHSMGKPMITQKSLNNFLNNKGTRKYCVLSKIVEFRKTVDKTYLRIKK